MRRVGRRRARLVAVALTLAACGSGGTTSTTTVASGTPTTAGTVAPATSTTVAPTTVAATTTVAPTSTTVAAGCRERGPARRAAPAAAAETALAAFGPLGAEPSLRVDVRPASWGSGDFALALDVHRIPGGLLVAAGPGSDAGTALPATPTSVTAVDWDGTVRWVRCLPTRAGVAYLAGAALGPSAVLVRSAAYAGGVERAAWTALSLADGADVALPAGFAAAVAPSADGAAAPAVLSQSDGWLLLAPADPADASPPVTIDLVSLAATVLPAPPAPGATDDPSHEYVIDAAGDVVLYAASQYTPTPVKAWWHGGAWRTGSAATASVGVRVVFASDTADTRGELRGVDGAGRTRWRLPTRREPGLEATGIYVDGDVALGETCLPRTGTQDCDYELTAVDRATGAVRWKLAGFRLVAATPADGFALVTDGAVIADTPDYAWTLVDDRTGAAVSGQRWADQKAFNHPCCGESEIAGTGRDGGVVIVVDGRRVRAWLPAAADAALGRHAATIG